MIAERLREIREQTGMNKKEFSEFLGLKYTTYNGYETGSREPGSDFLKLISAKLDISTDYLLGLQDKKEILHQYNLRSAEYSKIQKYRFLDNYGKDVVDFVLEKEYERCQEQNTSKSSHVVRLDESDRSYLEPDAAHERTDIELTDEGQQHDDDIMNDDSEWE